MKSVYAIFSIVGGVIFYAGSLFADAPTDGIVSQYAGFAIAAALAIGLPALGGGLGQGKAAAAALEGIARNPGASGKIFVPMILGMALIESLVLFGLIIAFALLGKIA